MSGPPTRIQSVTRAMRLLFLIADSAQGLTATEAARVLSVSVPTAHHLLGTLVAEGALARDAGRRYVIGPRIGVLCDAFTRDLAVPHYLSAPLRWIADQTGETVYLTAWRRQLITILQCVDGVHAVRVAGLFPGVAIHAHARASGKVLLAHLAPDALEAYLRSYPLVAVTDRTIVDSGRFAGELAHVRELGFATDVDEFVRGVSCISVPVLEGRQSVIAAYTISAPSDRYAEQPDVLRQTLLRAARSVSRHARGDGSRETKRAQESERISQPGRQS